MTNYEEELSRMSDQDQIHHGLLAATQRAVALTRQWIAWSMVYFPKLDPYVVLVGDGGLVLEWGGQGRDFVALHFDGEDAYMDTIFYKLNSKAEHDDISENRVIELISKMTPTT